MVDYTKEALGDKIKICPICGKPGLYQKNPEEYVHKMSPPEKGPGGSAWIVEDSCYVDFKRDVKMSI